jgi:hypothetical protein
MQQLVTVVRVELPAVMVAKVEQEVKIVKFVL